MDWTKIFEQKQVGRKLGARFYITLPRRVSTPSFFVAGQVESYIQISNPCRLLKLDHFRYIFDESLAFLHLPVCCLSHARYQSSISYKKTFFRHLYLNNKFPISVKQIFLSIKVPTDYSHI